MLLHPPLQRPAIQGILGERYKMVIENVHIDSINEKINLWPKLPQKGYC